MSLSFYETSIAPMQPLMKNTQAGSLVAIRQVSPEGSTLTLKLFTHEK